MTVQEIIEKLESIKDDPRSCLMAEQILSRGVDAVIRSAEQRALRMPRIAENQTQSADNNLAHVVSHDITQTAQVCIHRGKLLVGGSCGCSRAYECNHPDVVIDGNPAPAFGRSCGAGKCKMYAAA